jgi:branched-chain amino acid transport system ATP-binding protein
MQAVWNISLEVDEREIVSLLGPNGSGKSTMMKTILGVIHPSSGMIRFRGERIDNLPSPIVVEKGIVYVPEGRRIFNHMSVLENLELGSHTKRCKKSKKENLKWVFELFPILEERQKQLVGTLSGGEQQMLAIARGLMGMPELLMLDEPSFGIAPMVVSKIFEIIKEINERGVPILLVEQDVVQALEVSDMAYVIEAGRNKLKGNELLENEYLRKAYLGL